MAAVVPFGWWPSPFSAASVAGARVSRSSLSSDGAALYWLESRPAEGGRQVLLRSAEGAPPVEVSPPGANLRSRVHEYGGGAYCLVPGTGRFAAVESADQRVRLYGAGAGVEAVALTRTSPRGVRVGHGDLRATVDGRWILAVRERLSDGGVGRDVVACSVTRPGHRRVVCSGRDFFAAPRPDPTGRKLAWICWEHPDMPWDASELWVGDLHLDGPGPAVTAPRRIAGGRDAAGGGGASVGQPLWCADGTLVYVCDEGGWWQPWRWSAGGGASRIADDEAEYHGPDWVLGQSTMAELADGSLVGRGRSGGRDGIVVLGPEPGRVATVDQPCVTVSSLCAHRDRPAWIGASPWSPATVWAVGADGRASPVLPDPVPKIDRDDVAAGEPFSAPATDAPGTAGRAVPGLFYRPRLRGTVGPPGARPPLVVFCHSGPTGNVDAGFDPMVQFLTTRGFAVAAVDYAGSTGYGRAFRRNLEGVWGIVDSDDCAAAAAFLADAGAVDGDHMAVRGPSAGGFTALCALARSRIFVAGTSLYGVTDLLALARSTHDFESRYSDRLVGPLPEAADEFVRRSPVARVGDIDAAVLVLQGIDDPVVPVAQATAMVEALRARGRRCEYLAFDGEAHGFRRAETLEACATAELAFYQDVLCVEGPGAEVGGW